MIIGSALNTHFITTVRLSLFSLSCVRSVTLYAQTHLLGQATDADEWVLFHGNFALYHKMLPSYEIWPFIVLE